MLESTDLSNCQFGNLCFTFYVWENAYAKHYAKARGEEGRSRGVLGSGRSSNLGANGFGVSGSKSPKLTESLTESFSQRIRYVARYAR